MNGGIAALLMVCMKSMSAIARKAPASTSAWRSLDCSQVNQPTPKIDSDTMMLKNSTVLWNTR
jgi:hypothetical protein